MKCNHRGADGESSIIKGICGICGTVVINNSEEELNVELNKLKEYIEKIELQNDRYVEENKALRKVVRNMAQII